MSMSHPSDHPAPMGDSDEAHPLDDREPSPETLVTLTVQPTEFHANTIVALLEAHGIEARAFGTGTSWLGLAMWGSIGSLRGVPVQVQQKNLDAAREIIKQRKAESVDIDWDSIDVGEPEKESPRQSGGADIPWLARLAFLAAVAVVILTIIGLLLVFILP